MVGGHQGCRRPVCQGDQLGVDVDLLRDRVLQHHQVGSRRAPQRVEHIQPTTPAAPAAALSGIGQTLQLVDHKGGYPHAAVDEPGPGELEHPPVDGRRGVEQVALARLVEAAGEDGPAGFQAGQCQQVLGAGGEEGTANAGEDEHHQRRQGPRHCRRQEDDDGNRTYRANEQPHDHPESSGEELRAGGARSEPLGHHLQTAPKGPSHHPAENVADAGAQHRPHHGRSVR